MSRRLGSLGGKTCRRDLDRSVHDGPSFHINSVGKRLVAFCAPGIRVTRQYLGVALWAVADGRNNVRGLNKSFLIHGSKPHKLDARTFNSEGCVKLHLVEATIAIVLICWIPCSGDTAYIKLLSSVQVIRREGGHQAGL
jgi:hypothetical protein